MKLARGFTLIELAIVLVIITILIGGLAVPLSAQIQARRIGETNRTLEEARETILGYIMTHNTLTATTCDCQYNADTTLDTSPTVTTCPTNFCPLTSTSSTTLSLQFTRHYLPCPDLNGADPEPNLDNDGDGSLSDLNNGREDRYVTGSVGSCATTSGHFPWVTLATAAQDAWGNRLGYSVENREYADSSKGLPNLALLTPPYAALNLKRICRGSACTAVDAVYLPAVIFSHGPNGWGAHNVNGNTLKPPSSADELENTDADADFVSRSPSKAGDAAGEYDDLVVWISDGLLRSRVCPAGGCP